MSGKYLFSLLMLTAAFPAVAQEAQVDYPISTARTIPLEPGASGEISIQVGNTTPQVSPALRLRIGSWDTPGYAVQLESQGGCGPFETSSPQGSLAHGFLTLAPIPAGESRTCTLEIARDVGSLRSAILVIGVVSPPPSSGHSELASTLVGSFTDVGLVADVQSRTIDSSSVAHNVYRIGARNSGALPLAAPIDITLGPVCTPAPFTIDANMEGGCELVAAPCMFTGSDGVAARLGNLAAGATNSCLVRFLHPASERHAIFAQVQTEFLKAETLVDVFDSNHDNNTQSLTVLLGGSGGPGTILPSQSWWSLLVLTAGLSLIAARMRRRHPR
jgi:hypothetical protein